MLSNTLRMNFCYLKIIHILHSRYHSKIIRCILKNKQKNKCVCILEIIRLILMKMKMKMKNRSQRYEINKPRPRHGYKYTRYKKCLSMRMLIFINHTHREKAVFYSIHYKNGCLTPSGLFHMFTQSINFYTFHYHILKSADVWK